VCWNSWYILVCYGTHLFSMFSCASFETSFETVPRRILWHRGAVLIGHEEAVEQMGLAPKDLHRSDLAVVHLIFH